MHELKHASRNDAHTHTSEAILTATLTAAAATLPADRAAPGCVQWRAGSGAAVVPLLSLSLSPSLPLSPSLCLSLALSLSLSLSLCLSLSLSLSLSVVHICFLVVYLSVFP